MGKGAHRVRCAPSEQHAQIKSVIVIGAGPVGLCLSLALGAGGRAGLPDRGARRRQFPRAGAARRHQPSGDARALDRIGLYDKLEPRGIIAPLFHYWDRHENELIAEFDHAHLKDDTRFPYVLQCERIKIVEEALKLAKAHPDIELRLSTDLHVVHAKCRRRDRTGDQSGGRTRRTFAAPTWSAARARAASCARTSTSSSKASPMRTAR